MRTDQTQLLSSDSGRSENPGEESGLTFAQHRSASFSAAINVTNSVVMRRGGDFTIQVRTGAAHHGIQCNYFSFNERGVIGGFQFRTEAAQKVDIRLISAYRKRK